MARTWILAPLAALALACGVAGCGTSDADQAKSAVKSYLTAFANGDGKKACSLMTATTRAAFIFRARPITHTTDCAKSVALLKPQLSHAFKGIQVSDAKVSGNEAVVNVTSGPRSSPAVLRREGGKWRISTGPGTQ